MNGRNGTQRYGSLSIGLHWVMLLLFVAVYACIELRGYFPKGSDPREALKTWHFMLGLSVLALALLRVLVHLRSTVPPIVPDPPGWQKLAARLMHLALYALMIGLPLVGWLLLSAAGKPIPFFGLHLPALLGEGDDAMIDRATIVEEGRLTARFSHLEDYAAEATNAH